MNTSKLLIILLGLTIMSCSKPDNNPFMNEWKTPFGIPPFDKITEAHYMPALLGGIEMEKLEIQALVEKTDDPTFANTIEAFESSGQFLNKVANVFYNVRGTNATDELDSIAEEFSPIRTKHNDDIMLNAELFAKIKNVYDNVERYSLTTEQNTLLDKIYGDFVRNGANLNDQDKDALRKINEELSLLTLNFGQNVRNDGNQWGNSIRRV